MKFKKIRVCFIICIVLINIVSCCYATNLLPGVSIGDPDISIANAGNKIYGLVRLIAIICSVVVLMVLGIKYMMGSNEEKAEYKKAIRNYLIGVALAFCIYTIVKMAYNTAGNLFN